MVYGDPGIERWDWLTLIVAWASAMLYTGGDDRVIVWVLPGEEELMRTGIIDYCDGDVEENLKKAEKAFGIKFGAKE